MLAPSNFIFMNPVVLKKTCDHFGANLTQGWLNFLDDTKRALNHERPFGSEAFRVGENIAVTRVRLFFATG